MFRDRKDAGIQLAKALEKYKNLQDVLVLAIPRGGVEVGAQIAKYLGSDFDLIMCRKLQYPWTTESGYGALCEDGTLYINENALDGVTQEDILAEIAKQQEEIAHRIKLLRHNRPLKDIHNKIVILVDDGIAMGSTMRAAIAMIQKQYPKKIVVAVPTASPQAVEEFSRLVDEVIALYTPYPFYAVADAYENWYDVSDEEVLHILNDLHSSIKNDKE